MNKNASSRLVSGVSDGIVTGGLRGTPGSTTPVIATVRTLGLRTDKTNNVIDREAIYVLAGTFVKRKSFGHPCGVYSLRSIAFGARVVSRYGKYNAFPFPCLTRESPLSAILFTLPNKNKKMYAVRTSNRLGKSSLSLEYARHFDQAENALQQLILTRP